MENEKIDRAGFALGVIAVPVMVIGLIVLITAPSIVMFDMPEYDIFFTRPDPSRTATAYQLLFAGFIMGFVGTVLRTYAHKKKEE